MLVGQAGDGQGHAFLGMGACVFVELIRHRAAVFTIEAQHDLFRQLGVGLQRCAVAQLQHARHQGSLAALGVEH
ncbi:hypothetical protein D3C76_1405170 [compost metagenome]